MRTGFIRLITFIQILKLQHNTGGGIIEFMRLCTDKNCSDWLCFVINCRILPLFTTVV